MDHTFSSVVRCVAPPLWRGLWEEEWMDSGGPEPEFHTWRTTPHRILLWGGWIAQAQPPVSLTRQNHVLPRPLSPTAPWLLSPIELKTAFKWRVALRGDGVWVTSTIPGDHLKFKLPVMVRAHVVPKDPQPPIKCLLSVQWAWNYPWELRLSQYTREDVILQITLNILYKVQTTPHRGHLPLSLTPWLPLLNHGTLLSFMLEVKRHPLEKPFLSTLC